MENKTKIIYLTGKPGVGKYTIAKALSKYGFIVCDNQLINNPIFELLNYDGLTAIPEFAWNSISSIRNSIFDFIAIEKNNNYVLTNNLYEDEEDRQLYQQVKQISETRNSIFIPVRLLISQEEHLKRVTQAERRLRWKSINSNEIYNNTPLLKIEDPNFLELDVSKPELCLRDFRFCWFNLISN
ncbi:MAG: AAA family ATPase [Rickettsia endosymbiont of Bryobia graminum]|nr:AAA family ATPase [Rickettsia endosymbiont of Bryobia graminum]